MSYTRGIFVFVPPLRDAFLFRFLLFIYVLLFPSKVIAFNGVEAITEIFLDVLVRTKRLMEENASLRSVGRSNVSRRYAGSGWLVAMTNRYRDSPRIMTASFPG